MRRGGGSTVEARARVQARAWAMIGSPKSPSRSLPVCHRVPPDVPPGRRQVPLRRLRSPSLSATHVVKVHTRVPPEVTVSLDVRPVSIPCPSCSLMVPLGESLPAVVASLSADAKGPSVCNRRS